MAGRGCGPSWTARFFLLGPCPEWMSKEGRGWLPLSERSRRQSEAETWWLLGASVSSPSPARWGGGGTGTAVPGHADRCRPTRRLASRVPSVRSLTRYLKVLSHLGLLCPAFRILSCVCAWCWEGVWPPCSSEGVICPSPIYGIICRHWSVYM